MFKKVSNLYPRTSSIVRMMSDKKGESGSAGSIRAAGGGFAKMEIAHEEEYFYKQRQQQLAELKNKSVSEEEFRKNSIKDHEQAILRHKEAINKISK
ncbi:unnamed protein product [Diamesa serratosioi]